MGWAEYLIVELEVSGICGVREGSTSRYFYIFLTRSLEVRVNRKRCLLHRSRNLYP